jgi:hypothetical protein
VLGIEMIEILHAKTQKDGSLLSGFVIMFHRYDDISLFVSFVNISVSLDNLLQRIASIYDGFQLFRFNKLFEED